MIESYYNTKLRITSKEIAARLHTAGAPVVRRATANPTGQGGAFSTHFCDVEVDPETGKVTILRYTVIQVAGTAIHPAYVEGQMQAAVAQGIGWAISEEYFYDDSGRMVNSSYLDYRMPCRRWQRSPMQSIAPLAIASGTC